MVFALAAGLACTAFADDRDAEIERLKREAAAMRDRLQKLDDQIALMTKEVQYEQVRQSAEKVFHGDLPTVVATLMADGKWVAILADSEGGQGFFNEGDFLGAGRRIERIDDRGVVVRQGKRLVPLKREVKKDLQDASSTASLSSGAPVGMPSLPVLPPPPQMPTPQPMMPTPMR